MDIDDEPEIRTLRSELLKALRRTAFETYVNLGGEGTQPSAGGPSVCRRDHRGNNA